MALATVAEVRVIGGLPEQSKLPDSKISPHLDRAARELTRWIGDYSSATGDFLSDCKDSECCLTMHYLLPVLNTFFTSGISTLQKELGDMEFLFHGPDDIEKLRQAWWDRAEASVASYMGQEGAGKASIRFYAI